MIVLGDVSGIQRYLFDVAETGGGQARRLRARSFLVQALVERAALQRGWLHTLLELALARHGDKPDPLATARPMPFRTRNSWQALVQISFCQLVI